MENKRSGSGTGSLLLRKRLAEIESCEGSGESLKAYATRRGISVHTLYQAKKMARRQGLLPAPRNQKAEASRTKAERAPQFVEATAVLSHRPPSAAWRVCFAGGAIFESNTPLDRDFALCLIESLGSRS
jgi:hypothetical protein